MTEEKVYTLTEFAESVRLSVDQVRKHIDGVLPPLLEPQYSGRKPLISESERKRFIGLLPKTPVKGRA